MKIPNNCNESRLRSDTNKSTLSLPRKYSDASSVTSTASGETYYSALSETSSQGSSPSPSLGPRRMTWTCGRPVAIDKLVNKLEIPHTFVIHSYKRPTVCNVCRKLVSNSIRTGWVRKHTSFEKIVEVPKQYWVTQKPHKLQSWTKLVGTDEFCVKRGLSCMLPFTANAPSPPLQCWLLEENILVHPFITFSSAFNIAMGGGGITTRNFLQNTKCVMSFVRNIHYFLNKKLSATALYHR